MELQVQRIVATDLGACVSSLCVFLSFVCVEMLEMFRVVILREVVFSPLVTRWRIQDKGVCDIVVGIRRPTTMVAVDSG